MKHKKKQNALYTKQFESHFLKMMKSQIFIKKMKSHISWVQKIQKTCLFIGKKKENRQNKT